VGAGVGYSDGIQVSETYTSHQQHHHLTTWVQYEDGPIQSQCGHG